MQMRTSKTRNPLGSILRKRVSKQGQPIVVFDVRRRIRQEDGTYRDVTKRCYSRQEAILALAAMCLAGPHPPPYGHGHTSNGTRSITYKSYESAKDRCNNPNAISYKYYGERGIEFRFESFQAFLAEVGERPSKEYSLDRYPDNNGHYEPGNVRWATRKQQAANKNR
jgi:hypothetical protein